MDIKDGPSKISRQGIKISGNPDAPKVLDKVRYGRDYFVGTALQFTDEDVAVLLRVYGAILVGALL